MDSLIAGHRSLIDAIGTEHSHFISDMRLFQEGKLTVADFTARMKRLKNILETQDSSYKDGTEHFIAGFRSSRTFNISKGPTLGQPASRDLADSTVKLNAFSRSKKIRQSHLNGTQLDKFEVGVYRSSSDDFVQDAIEEISEAGGELRAIRHRLAGAREWLEDAPSPYFRMSATGQPIIGIDFTQGHSLAALSHELEHFRQWKEFKAEAKASGMSDLAASKAANERINLPENKYLGEKRSLDAELKAEVEIDSLLNKGLELPPRKPGDYGYINRLSYPRIEAIREIFFQEKLNPAISSSLRKKRTLHLEALVKEGEALRRSSIDAIQKQLDDGVGSAQEDLLKRKLAYFQNRLLFELIFAHGDQHRFRELGLFEELFSAFTSVESRSIGSSPNRQIQSIKAKEAKK